MKKDITSPEDIRYFVNTFYDRVRADDHLGDIFNGKIGDRWQVHLEKMYSFWQSLLFGDRSYNGRPFPPHMDLPVGREHFMRWVLLFEEVINENYEGPVAEEAKLRANTIAGIFQSKLEQMRQGEPF
ncbi:MAG: group III truncated hemoglobin [Bacteroidia bacterium]